MSPARNASSSISLQPGAGPLRRQLAIGDRRCHPGRPAATAVPPTVESRPGRAARRLARRGDDAYAQLAAQGFLEMRPRTSAARRRQARRPRPTLPGESPRRRPRYDFTSTRPDVTLFPRHEWRRALERAIRDAPAAELDYGDRHGSSALRSALAERLGRTRGVVTNPRRLVVVQGFAQGLDVVCATLSRAGSGASRSRTRPQRRRHDCSPGRPGDHPGPGRRRRHRRRRARADRSRRRARDARPPVPDRRRARAGTPPRAAAVGARRAARSSSRTTTTPSTATTAPPVGALQGLAPDHVAYIGSASKTLTPALRLGWLALPQRLARTAADTKWWRDSGSPSSTSSRSPTSSRPARSTARSADACGRIARAGASSSTRFAGNCRKRISRAPPPACTS